MTFICQKRHEPTKDSNKLTVLKVQSALKGEDVAVKAGRRGLIHLMPQRCLARLPFVAESAGQTQRTDRTLQDALCSVASCGQQDKAIICLDTSLACSPQLSAARLTAVLPAHRHRATQTYTILGCRPLGIKGQIVC